jgi:hypothetical protein
MSPFASPLNPRPHLQPAQKVPSYPAAHYSAIKSTKTLQPCVKTQQVLGCLAVDAPKQHTMASKLWNQLTISNQLIEVLLPLMTI